MPRPWIVRHRPRPQAALRLYCFPYAGAGASVYRTWAQDLPGDVEVCAVQYPGRESRFREPPFSKLEDLVGALTDGLAPHLVAPFAFFGHSLGSWAAFELARRLAALGRSGPAHLLVSGRRAPALPERFPLLHVLPDEEFIDQLEKRYGGIPSEITRDSDLLRILIPGLRADVTAVETHHPAPGPRLDCPISAFGGAGDEYALAAELEAWREETGGPFTLDLLPGGHFYLDASRTRLLSLIIMRLSESGAYAWDGSS